jgi:phospholipase C
MPGPLEHVVIIVKENHAFDNYFGSFLGANGQQLDQAPNPPPNDPRHDHATWMQRQSDTRFQLQYSEQDVPGYFAYARQFTLCDNYFTDVAGPSTPNHLMLICADAPIINNPHDHYRPGAASRYDLHSLPLVLEQKDLTWANYGGYAFKYVAELSGHRSNHARDKFAEDARAGQLPSVSWVYGDGGRGEADLSEHPKQNVTDGMNWTMDQVQAVVDGGLWNTTAIFITWDDWGGWFDHVDPAVVETWDSSRAQHPTEAYPEFDGDPFRYGSRVGCLALSPYAKQGYLSHQLNSHVSLLKFCETVFGLPALNQRDDQSNGMSDCFDFGQQPLPPPN